MSKYLGVPVNQVWPDQSVQMHRLTWALIIHSFLIPNSHFWTIKNVFFWTLFFINLQAHRFIQKIHNESFWVQLYKASLALFSGQNVNCSSKYNIEFTGIFAEKIWVVFSAKILANMSYLMIKVLMIP